MKFTNAYLFYYIPYFNQLPLAVTSLKIKLANINGLWWTMNVPAASTDLVMFKEYRQLYNNYSNLV